MKKKTFAIIFLLAFLFLINYFCLSSFKSGKDFLKQVGLSPFFLLKEKEISMDCNSLEGQIADLKKQVEELNNYLNLQPTENFKILARVIQRNTRLLHEMTINKGKKDNVQVGDAVLTDKGFIGIVTSTSKNSSIVSLITKEQLEDKISVQIDEKFYGLLVGYDNFSEEFIIKNISSNEEIKEGMLVKTGFSTTYPTGLFLGQITSVSKDHFDLEKEVHVKSNVDFHNIRTVMVIR